MFELDNAKTIGLIRDLADKRLSLHNTNGVPVLHVESALCMAQVSLQGAQLLKFYPRDGAADWLYSLPESELHPGMPIDAGIPICLPWFGRHPNPNYPIHGYLRDALWQLTELAMHGDNCVLVFTYQHTPTAFFDYSFTAEHRLCLGQDIQLELSIKNHSTKAMPLSFAWHSYFAVKASSNTQLTGLDNAVFLDNLQGLQPRLQQGTLQFGAEVDAVFENTHTAQTLLNGNHPLHISGHDCPTVIVWNPGPVAHNFVCVERGCAFADTITLAADQRFNARLLIKE